MAVQGVGRGEILDIFIISAGIGNSHFLPVVVQSSSSPNLIRSQIGLIPIDIVVYMHAVAIGVRESHYCATVKDNASIDPEVGALKGYDVSF